jgi:polyisoprenoid-binding protein YceI
MASSQTLTTPAVSPPEAEDALVPPGSWRVSEESLIGFTVRSFGRNLKGRFGSFSGHVVRGAGDSVLASGSVEVASIDTGIARRDDHLRSADFFDAENHPQITFASRRIIPARHGYEIPGTLTIKGVSRDIAMAGRLLAPEPGDDGETIRIAVESTIDRHAFGVRAPSRFELFGLPAAAHVRIRLLIVAVHDERGPVD